MVNNKISNVSPPDADGGIMASQRICDELAKNLQHPGSDGSEIPGWLGNPAPVGRSYWEHTKSY